ncbi:MAG: hypothetical protein HY063_01505 [Bacteroidetes bacterium]|nr:hypothetical protein [Bacteroidota bacterium]
MKRASKRNKEIRYKRTAGNFLYALCLIPLYLIPYTSSAQRLNGTKDAADNIIIYGDSFLFSIHEPKGWTGDVDNAKNYNSNIIFYQSKEGLKKNTLIQVLTYKKQDEEVNKDLESDVSNFKEKNHDLKEQTNEVSNKKMYPAFSKLVYVENVFYQYIAYVNPGKEFHNAFSVSMNIAKRTATKEEISAFKEIVSSLVVFKR